MDAGGRDETRFGIPPGRHRVRRSWVHRGAGTAPPGQTAKSFSRPRRTARSIWCISDGSRTARPAVRSPTPSTSCSRTSRPASVSPSPTTSPATSEARTSGRRSRRLANRSTSTAFEITVNVAGYKRATITRMPRKAQGAIELDVRLEPVVSGDVLAAGLGASDAPPYTRRGSSCSDAFVVWVIVRVARTSGRPPTTTR